MLHVRTKIVYCHLDYIVQLKVVPKQYIWLVFENALVGCISTTGVEDPRPTANQNECQLNLKDIRLMNDRRIILFSLQILLWCNEVLRFMNFVTNYMFCLPNHPIYLIVNAACIKSYLYIYIYHISDLSSKTHLGCLEKLAISTANFTSCCGCYMISNRMFVSE